MYFKNIQKGTILGIIFFLTACSQEQMLFHPNQLSKDHQFSFEHTYQEFFIPVEKNVFINGLLFKNKKSKGLIFYLHGNGGSVDSWANNAELYLHNHYDFFVLDYRGFGKSDGSISSEKELYRDVQIVYDTLCKLYPENQIVVIGFSIGTGIAAKLASENNPKYLVLKAPYYNIRHLARQYIKIVPILFLQYKLETNVYLQQVKCPVSIFHGDQDEIIDPKASIKLKRHLKKDDNLVILKGQKHNGINKNQEYQKHIEEILH